MEKMLQLVNDNWFLLLFVMVPVLAGLKKSARYLSDTKEENYYIDRIKKMQEDGFQRDFFSKVTSSEIDTSDDEDDLNVEKEGDEE